MLHVAMLSLQSLGPDSSRSYRSLAATAPSAERIPTPVYFGVLPSTAAAPGDKEEGEGEGAEEVSEGAQYRGDDPMDPPLVIRRSINFMLSSTPRLHLCTSFYAFFRSNMTTISGCETRAARTLRCSICIRAFMPYMHRIITMCLLRVHSSP